MPLTDEQVTKIICEALEPILSLPDHEFDDVIDHLTVLVMGTIKERKGDEFYRAFLREAVTDQSPLPSICAGKAPDLH